MSIAFFQYSEMKLRILNYKDDLGEESAHLRVYRSCYLIMKGQLVLEEHEDPANSLIRQVSICSKEISKSDRVIKTCVKNDKEGDKCKECSFSLIADLKEGVNELELEVSSLTSQSVLMNVKIPPVIYQKAERRRIENSVLPIFVIPSDNPSIELKEIFPKIIVALKLIQSLYGELLAGQVLGRRSFVIDEDCSDERIVRLELSTEDISQMNAYQVWECVAKTLRKTEELWSDGRKYVAFLTTPWKDSGRDFKSALGGGGLAIFNVSICDPWPAAVEDIFEALWNSQTLESEYPQLLPQLHRFGSIGRSVGDFVSASLGSLAHELGHLFDLAHSEVGLMGKDYHKLIRKVLAPPVIQDNPDLAISKSSATLLYHHKWFQGQEGSSSLDSEVFETSKSSFQTSPSNFKVISTLPFTTIQLRSRSDSDSVVLKEWTFSSPTFSFLPQKGDIPLTSCPSGDAFLVCQNISGDILKLSISRSSLSTSFTRLTSSRN